MFLDRATIKIQAGNGGSGVVAWRRERYIPKGGPNGGNGSKGGDICFQADINIFSLDWYRNRRQLVAENGGNGGSNLKQGKKGIDLILKVPCGTLIRDAQTHEILSDLTTIGQKYTVCVGGRGGRGNASFKTSTSQAPNYCTPGSDGEIKEIELELKMIADIGFVGYPNAGKSTLINSLANVSVKIAPYPFTTLQPNLGYIQFEDYRKILLADIPGIIEGASQDRGLGIEFLRHIERTKGLVYVLDAAGVDGRHPWQDFQILQQELQKYNAALLEKPFIVILNKVDLEQAKAYIEEFYMYYPYAKDQILTVSALQKQGTLKLAQAFYSIVYPLQS